MTAVSANLWGPAGAARRDVTAGSYGDGMATWTSFADEAPELATLAEQRIAASGLLMLGTLRRDGFPRISPVEPTLMDDGISSIAGRVKHLEPGLPAQCFIGKLSTVHTTGKTDIGE